jgi:hypothetical protein
MDALDWARAVNEAESVLNDAALEGLHVLNPFWVIFMATSIGLELGRIADALETLVDHGPGGQD